MRVVYSCLVMVITIYKYNAPLFIGMAKDFAKSYYCIIDITIFYFISPNTTLHQSNPGLYIFRKAYQGFDEICVKSILIWITGFLCRTTQFTHVAGGHESDTIISYAFLVPSIGYMIRPYSWHTCMSNIDMFSVNIHILLHAVHVPNH